MGRRRSLTSLLRGGAVIIMIILEVLLWPEEKKAACSAVQFSDAMPKKFQRFLTLMFVYFIESAVMCFSCTELSSFPPSPPRHGGSTQPDSEVRF